MTTTQYQHLSIIASSKEFLAKIKKGSPEIKISSLQAIVQFMG